MEVNEHPPDHLHDGTGNGFLGGVVDLDLADDPDELTKKPLQVTVRFGMIGK